MVPGRQAPNGQHFQDQSFLALPIWADKLAHDALPWYRNLVQTFAVMLKVSFSSGAAQVVPLLLFDSKEKAHAELLGMKPKLAELLSAQLVMLQGQAASPLGLSGEEFLQSLGISGVGLHITAMGRGEPAAPAIVLS